MSNRSSYVKNTFVLFVSMLISKVVGAIFKIPLTNIIGGVGMAYYSSAYSLYTPVFALTASAIPTVIIAEVARNMAVSRIKNISKIIRISFIVFGCVGLIGTGFMLLCAKPFSEFVANSPDSFYSIIVISPSVFLCCISSVLKGYYEGMCNMVPTAVAQIAESVGRAVIGLSSSVAVIEYTIERFNNAEKVFGVICETQDKAIAVALPYAAAAAVMAVTLSELICLACLAIRKLFFKNNSSADIINSTDSCKDIVKRLLKECMPIAFCALAVNLSSFIDLITIPKCIGFALTSNSDYFYSVYSAVIEHNGGTLRLSDFIYGSYSGVAGTVFGLVPSFTGMFGKSAMPEIALAWSKGNKPELKRRLDMVIKSNFIIGFPLYLGLAGLAKPVIEILYSGRPLEAAISVQPLFIMCIGGVFLTLTSTCFSVFQMIGRADLPIKLTLVSSAIKLIFNVFLISIPEININGAAISNMIAYAASALGGYFALENATGIDFKLFSKMKLPLFAAVVCTFSAVFSHSVLENHFGNIVSLIMSAFAGCIIYIILLIIAGGYSIKNLLKRRN